MLTQCFWTVDYGPLCLACKQKKSKIFKSQLSYHNNNVFTSTQDQVGGPQEGRIEEITSKIGEGECWGSRRWEIKEERRKLEGFVVLIEKLWFRNLAFFCYQARQSGPWSTVQKHCVYILQVAIQNVQMTWICRLGRYLMIPDSH